MKVRTPHFGPFAGRLCRVTEAGGLEPLGEPAGDPRCVVLLPPEGPRGAGTEEGIEIEGEIAGPDTRGNRRALEESIVRNHGEAFRDWARAKAEEAVHNWDRGVRSGRIARPPR